LIVNKQIHKTHSKLLLQSGKTLENIELAYEHYGVLNSEASNAILIFHALTSNNHVAGKYYKDESKSGWWDVAVGPSKAIDTERFFVVCVNVIGGSSGSTSPASINYKTNKPYALDFPVVTIKDMARATKFVLDYLKIKKLYAVIGGCFGGFLVMEWLILFPESTQKAIIISATPSTNAYSMALWETLRQAIYFDPNFNNGNYYNSSYPTKGIGFGRLVGVLLWMSKSVFDKKFGLKLINNSNKPEYKLDPEFEAQRFMHNILGNANIGIDPNSLLYLTKAIDYFNIERDYGSLTNAFKKVKTEALLVSYDNDWRYPVEEMEKISKAFYKLGIPVKCRNLHTSFGHGAFIYDFMNGTNKLINEFLNTQQ